MKILIYAILVVTLSAMNSYSISNLNNDDANCLKKINTLISKELKNQFRNRYSQRKYDIKLILRFYISSMGKADSIVVAKSNLLKLGIDEKRIVRNLISNRYDCLWEVYYSNDLKPSYVIVVFNPKLSSL